MTNERLAGVLGIDEPQDDFQLIETIRNGLPASAAKTLAGKLSLPLSDLAKCLRVSCRTLNRAPLSPMVSDRLVAVAKVYVRCKDVFDTDDKCVAWLKVGNCALGGISPMDLLDTNAGVDVVLALLGRIEYGVFS